MSPRPRLKEQLRPLRRGDGVVQFGLDPAVGVVLEGLTDGEIELLERLDGSLDEHAATAWARRRGIPRSRVAALLATLRAHALTVDSPAHRLDLAELPDPLRRSLRPDAEALACAYRRDDDGYAVLARRRRARAVVDGSGGLPALVAQVLRQAGVGQVACGRYAAAAVDGPHEGAGPDLVVLVGARAVEAARALPWLGAGTPHLPVVMGGTRAEVGPVVRPGSGPCLRCLDLARADHDPGWPAVLAQLAPARVGPPADTCGETSLVCTTAGLAAMLALGALDGHPAPAGTSFEVALATPHLGQRLWTRHPACDCPTGDTGGAPADGAAPEQATMAG